MTQTTQTTANSQQPTANSQELTANSQEPTSQPAETTTATAPQPEQTAQQTSQQPKANSQEPAKSAFISDGKLPQSKPQPTKPTASNEDLKAQLTALQARLDAIESQRTTERRTAEVERIIAPLSDTLKAVYRRTPFASLTDEEYTQLTETIKKEVTELATADKARGAVFSRPTASKPTDSKPTDKETAEVIRRLNL